MFNLTNEQKRILMNILLNEMQTCNNQTNHNIYDLLQQYKKDCHEIYNIINESMD